jgi:hypothetical protein
MNLDTKSLIVGLAVGYFVLPALLGAVRRRAAPVKA